MGKRIVVMEQDAYELLQGMVKEIAITRLLMPVGVESTKTDQAAQDLINAVHGAVPEVEPSQLGAEGEAPLLSFTAGSPEWFKAVKDRMVGSGEKYPMELNWSCFCNLLDCLSHVAQSEDHQLASWADDFLSSIGVTLRVEAV